MRALALVILVVMNASCVGLRPRTTLEGMPFNVAGVASVHAGLGEAEVRAILGEPFEIRPGQPDTLWRYYERFTPRGCDRNPPVISQEFRVAFSAGRVVSTELSIPVAVR